MQGPCGRKTQWAETLKVGLTGIQRVKRGLAQDVVQTMQDFTAMRMISFELKSNGKPQVKRMVWLTLIFDSDFGVQDGL